MKSPLKIRRALLLAPFAANPVWAVTGGLPTAGHGDSSPEWEVLRARLFPGRSIEASGQIIRLETWACTGDQLA